jgi:four helix bundle protein
MAFRFRNFEVYVNSRNFINKIYGITGQFPQMEQFGLTAQLRRAALSIALNIAEGSDRGSDRDFNRFIQMAMGSINEVVAALDIAFDNNYINQSSYNSVISDAEVVIKQLSNLSKKLKSR